MSVGYKVILSFPLFLVLVISDGFHQGFLTSILLVFLKNQLLHHCFYAILFFYLINFVEFFHSVLSLLFLEIDARS